MTLDRMIELLEIEHECMLRASHDDCNRLCNECDLLQDDDELHEMYTDVIGILKENRPVVPIIGEDKDTFSGSLWYVCPACKVAIDYRDKCCRHCGRRLKWDV